MRNRIAVAVLGTLMLTTPIFAAPQPDAAAAVASTVRLAAQSFPLPVPQYLAGIISRAAQQYGVNPNLIAAMAFRESRFDPNAVSSRGAQGILQLMPGTARSLGVTNSFDPEQNVFGATKYLRSLLDRFNGNLDLTLAAYNAGPDLVAKVGPNATQEAIEYVAAVKDYYLNALRAL